MELIIFLAVIFAVFLYVMLRGAHDEKKRRAGYRQDLKKLYGSFQTRQYKAEEMDKISSLYRKQRACEGEIDDITWNDLNMDNIFAMTNFTQSSSGEEYLYAMLRRPRLSDSDRKLENMDRHVDYMMENEEKRLDTLMILNDLGKTGKYSLYDYMNFLEGLGRRSNIKHYMCMLILAVSIVLIFADTTLGVVLVICAACVNITTYMKEKSTSAPYVSTFAYIMRMLEGADRIVKLDYGDKMSDYVSMLKDRQSKFKGFDRNSKMVLKMNSSTGSIDEILFDYIKMLTHIDLIKFNKMMDMVQQNKNEIFEMTEAIGYIDAVISVAYFRAALPYYCIPELTEGVGDDFQIDEGFHPAIENPVPNSFTQSRGMLITGSNASGKSTFLKMTAINAILAQTIHTCGAKKYSGNYYRIYSSMSLRDNLDNGESYYIVEIKALKRIMDEAGKASENPVLCFVDEVLRGTNTVERIAASAQILEKLSKKGILCFAATHDIELTHLLERTYDNFHFEEEVCDGDVLFSYHLLEGRSHSRNAIKLLEIIGFSDDIIKKANDMAKNFIENGEWDYVC